MTKRTDRVREAIRRLASEIIHSELHDPRIKGLITITKTEVTHDLRFAKIFYSVLGDEKTKNLVGKGLKSAKNFIRTRLADELKLRYATDIAFILDEGMEYTDKIDRILDDLHREEDDGKNRETHKND